VAQLLLAVLMVALFLAYVHGRSCAFSLWKLVRETYADLFALGTCLYVLVWIAVGSRQLDPVVLVPAFCFVSIVYGLYAGFVSCAQERARVMTWVGVVQSRVG